MAPDPATLLHPSLTHYLVSSGWRSLRPTQVEAIQPILDGHHCILLAPTAGGKTEAAALPVLTRIAQERWPGPSVLYVAPIRALLNNLSGRLEDYSKVLGLRVQLWHGDVATATKSRAVADPPDVLITTPESVQAMTFSAKLACSGPWLENVRIVVVDELHAFASDRGWQLRAILQRLDRLTGRSTQRIGLSATISNPDELLAWLAPQGERRVVGRSTVSADADVEIDYAKTLGNAAYLVANMHRGEKRLVYCDSKAQAEKLCEGVRSYGVETFLSHSALSPEARRSAEAGFARGRNCVVVATSTLELGLDVGDLDRVIQIDSPSSVSSFLQRMGRTGRRPGARRNCLFLTTDEDALLLALGLTQKWSEGWVEAAVAPPQPWHIVAQQALALAIEPGAAVTRSELCAALSHSFPELDAREMREIVAHLVATEFLLDESGLMRAGTRLERRYGHGHYRDLLAAFDPGNTYAARHGSTAIGSIDIDRLEGRNKPPEGQALILSGRTWVVSRVDHKRRQVFLEPSKGSAGGAWVGGSAPDISYEIAQGTRQVLLAGPSPLVKLSRRAQSQLEALRATHPAPCAPFPHPGGVVGTEGKTWTFAGDVLNRTLARAFGQSRSRTPASSAFNISAPLDSVMRPYPDFELADDELRSGPVLKFRDCLSARSLRKIFMARRFCERPSDLRLPSAPTFGVGEPQDLEPVTAEPVASGST